MNRISDAPILEANDAHVWMFRTEISPDQHAEFRNVLSRDEIARADRFMFEPDRMRFVASHGRMRLILGSYCEIHPRDLVFESSDHGKPFLRKPSVPVQFNLSHSDLRAALVVTRTMRCGIDIERIRPEISDQAIAERFFCAQENEWLRSLPSDQRIHGFFRLWSVKESILKADGKGMSIPLSNVDASNILARTSSYVSLQEGARVLSLWVGELPANEGYTAALAVEGSTPGVRIIEEDTQTG
jgi:4'-phosphopantetheinyl transferase